MTTLLTTNWNEKQKMNSRSTKYSTLTYLWSSLLLGKYNLIKKILHPANIKKQKGKLHQPAFSFRHSCARPVSFSPKLIVCESVHIHFNYSRQSFFFTPRQNEKASRTCMQRITKNRSLLFRIIAFPS